MQRFFESLDGLAETTTDSTLAKWLERTAFIFLVLMVVSSPHSIAATQTSWLIGMAAWLVRLFISPRREKYKFGLLDLALWGLFIWSVISSFFSYEPAVSLDRLRGVAVFLIFYFVVGNLRNLRAVYFLAFALILSCMVNVAWMPVQKLIGRGVEIHSIKSDGALAKAMLKDGDGIMTVDGKKVWSPEEVLSRIEESETVKIVAYRRDYDFFTEIKKGDIPAGANAMQRLGFDEWKPSRRWRSSGFFGHYTTYAEVIQLIGSLTLGLLVAGFFAGRRKTAPETAPQESTKKRTFGLLSAALAGLCMVLLMTVTRASQLAFVISGFVIFIVGASRKWILAGVAVGLPLILAGLFILQQNREVGFFDAKDDSTLYRFTMWKDGIRIWSETPKNVMLGVGMDSIQKHWREWDMFNGGFMPMGHFHSTPVQLLVERGVPALAFWLMIVGVYSWTLLTAIRRDQGRMPWQSMGILLGCLGGMVGFFASGLMHYNLGDQEVAMMFFLLMGLGIKIADLQTTSQNFTATGT